MGTGKKSFMGKYVLISVGSTGQCRRINSLHNLMIAQGNPVGMLLCNVHILWLF